MDAGNLIFLLLIVGSVFGMFFMHRGHGDGGMGGCGGHSQGHSDEPGRDARRGDKEQPLLGPPGTQSRPSAPAPAEGRKHRHGC